MTLDILFEDEYLVAVHKPAGLMVHRSYVDAQETTFLLQLLRDQLDQYVYPIHRLDRPTSGLILFAKSPEIAASMTEQFSQRSVSKTYHAIVRGYVPNEGEIDYPLKPIRDKKTPHKYKEKVDKPAQPAQTLYWGLQGTEIDYPSGKFDTSRYAFVKIKPLTGRTHQIRRHFKHIFHPIVGDTRYSDNHHNTYFREQLASNRLLLAATQLTFLHPVSGKQLTIDCPLESNFQDVLEAFSWHPF